jgi:hypothetical protein
MSPYDLRSVEANGEPRCIEVKSTTALDASEPFPISAAELEFAFNNRSRYSIYRVTDVRSASPEIFRYRDPLLAVRVRASIATRHRRHDGVAAEPTMMSRSARRVA